MESHVLTLGLFLEIPGLTHDGICNPEVTED